MGAPVGNRFAAKAKQWQAAIERALERMGDPSVNPDQPVERTPKMKTLDALAEAFVKKMQAEGDLGFFKEFGDRLDGKPTQQTEISGPDGGAVESSLTVTFVDASGVSEQA
jgi:hypothetical protein